MRLLIPVVWLTIFPLAAAAQSPFSQAPSTTLPKTASVIVIGPGGISGKVGPDAAKILASSTLRAGLQKAFAQAQASIQVQASMQAQASMHECFTLRTYAPEAPKPAGRAGVIERPYAPQRFALRSTCSHIGTFETIPLSAPSVPDR